MELGVGLPTSGSKASPEAIGRVAEEAERIGLAAVWTYERLLRPTEPIPMDGLGQGWMAQEFTATGVPLARRGAGFPAVERAARMGLGLALVMSSWEMLRDTVEPLDGRAPLTGSIEQVAGDLAELRSIGTDQVFWTMVDTDPDEQLHGLEGLLTREGR